jgi:hypothetical protein
VQFRFYQPAMAVVSMGGDFDRTPLILDRLP